MYGLRRYTFLGDHVATKTVQDVQPRSAIEPSIVLPQVDGGVGVVNLISKISKKTRFTMVVHGFVCFFSRIYYGLLWF